MCFMQSVESADTFKAKIKNCCTKKIVFCKCYLDLEDKIVFYESENTKKSLPFDTLFVEQRKDIDRSSVLYSIKVSFKLMHADIADIQFFSESPVDLKYCLLLSIFLLLKRIPIPRKLDIA